MADGTKPGAKSEPEAATVQLPRGEKDARKAPALIATVVPESPIVPTTEAPAMPGWRYTIKAEIARGGMGRVVEATDTVLGRTVALKEALSADPEAVRRFQRETRITAKLEHPAIVPVHDAGTAPGGAPFYVMRKVSGRPLEDLVDIHAALPERLALLQHVVAAAHAVAHAHERGIIHRDIKPANILIGDLGETIVIDWGLAKAIGEADDAHGAEALAADDIVHTRAGVVFGTPGFMSPEQLRGAPADERCDVYALGATLYYLLVRKPPHHARTADDMMQAALDGPPEPLRELEPGVPRELATIVDKALAHDAAGRYRDAGALAEDLQRFLAGQLVASHHYSPRERVLRFVRKNRALVGVVGAATAALVIGGWVAISRIVDERDRADAQAQLALREKQAAEEQRAEVADKLALVTVSQARALASTDPTRAVAMVQPLVTPQRWRDVRAIAGEARAHGVAYGLPAAPHTLSLELSQDGQQALAAGDDGTIRLYDLVHRTSRTLVETNGPPAVRWGDGEHAIVGYHERLVTIIELPTGARRDVAATTAIASLAVQGPIAYWVDVDRAVWRLDLAGNAPQKVAIDEPVAQVVPSPDGRWVALAGASHLLIVDRTQPTLPPEVLADGATRAVAWAADASHLVALVDDAAVDIAMEPSPALVRRQTVGNRHAIAYIGGEIVTAGPTGVVAGHDDAHARKLAGDYPLGLREARGGIAITASAQGTVGVISDEGDQLLVAPGVTLSMIEASPRSPFVVAASEGRLLVWDLDAIQPRRLAASAPTSARFVTDAQLIATFVDGPAQWIDLRTGKQTPLGTISPLIAAAGSPDGSRALIIDATHHGRLVAPVGEPTELPGDLERAAFLDDKRFVIASTAGVITLDDAGRPITLARRSAVPLALAARPGWVAAAFSDGTLWRIAIGGRESTLSTATRTAIALAPDGTVIYATDRELRAWPPDGGAVVIATLDRPIATLALYDGDRVLAIASDGSARLIGLGRDRDALAVGPLPKTASLGAQLAVALSPGGVLDVIDPVARLRWTLASGKGQALGYAELSPGDGHVLATTPGGLLVWTLAAPHDAEATTRWLGEITNARLTSDPTPTLVWR